MQPPRRPSRSARRHSRRPSTRVRRKTLSPESNDYRVNPSAAVMSNSPSQTSQASLLAVTSPAGSGRATSPTRPDGARSTRRTSPACINVDADGQPMSPGSSSVLISPEDASPVRYEFSPRNAEPPQPIRIQQDGLVSPSEVLSSDASLTQRGRESYSRSYPVYNPYQRNAFLAYVAVALTVLAFCALITAILFIAVPIDSQVTTCTSAPCGMLDVLLETSVDLTVDPCSNFYAHICNGWARSQSLSVYQSHLRDFVNDVDRILEHIMVRWRAPTAPQVVAALYQTCTNVLVRDAKELPAFRRQLHLMGVTWPHVSPNPELVLTAASVYAAFQITALLRVRRIPGSGTSGALQIAPDESFPREWSKTREQLLRVGSYERFFNETAIIYTGNTTAKNGSLLDYQVFVANEETILGTLVNGSKDGNNNEHTTIHELAKHTQNIPAEKWRMVLNRLRLPGNTDVFVSSGYLRKVDRLLGQIGEPILHYYLGWCVVQQMRRFIDSALAYSWYRHEGTNNVLNENGEWRARADCFQLTEKLVGWLSFERFSLLTTDADDYGYVSSVTTAVSEQLVRQIERAAWSHGPSPVNAADFRVNFDESTTNVVKGALDYSDLTNHSSLLTNWMDIVAVLSTINATFRDRIPTTHVRDLVARGRYSLFDNRTGKLSLPPLFAMLPVYRPQLSDSVKFGALGTLLAVASFQVFLFKVSNDAGALDEISRRLHCFVDSSATNRSDPLELFHLAASADVALAALRAQTQGDRRRLRSFNSLQTFFVLMCYLLCVPDSSAGAPVAETICNEAVKNSDSFPIAFRCAADKPMNPPQKCRFF